MQDFFRDTGRCRLVGWYYLKKHVFKGLALCGVFSRSQPKGDKAKPKDSNATGDNKADEEESRHTRAVTPGKPLFINLKPVSERKVKQRPKVQPPKKEEKSEYTQYFRGFMSGTSTATGAKTAVSLINT